VSFSYGEKEIISSLSVSFPDTGLCIILGKSGSGKTTLLSLLSKTLVPTKGTIQSSFSSKPGIVYQSPLLLDYLSVIDNVALPLRALGQYDEEKCLSVLKEVGLEGKENQNVSTLSGGESMRVSLARALVLDSEFLLLDEPTGQLDEKSSANIYKIIKDLSKERLLILVTHDEKNAFELADYLYEFKDCTLKLKSKKETTPCQSLLKKDEKEKGHLSLKDALYINSKFIRRRKWRVILTSFFTAFSLVVLFLGIAVKTGIPDFLTSLLNTCYESQVVEISVKKSIATIGHVTLEKYDVPSTNVLSSLGVNETYPSLNYFLPDNGKVDINNREIDVLFSPVIKEDRNKVSKGEGISSLGVVINSSFLEECSLNPEKAIGKKITVSHSFIMKASSLQESDVIHMDLTFTIKGISKEKNTFNQATVYYDYRKMSDLLKTKHLVNISSELDEELSVYDLISNPKYQGEDFCSRKTLALVNDPYLLKEKAQQEYGEKVKVSSKVLDLKESTQSIADSLIQVLLLFLSLTLISSFMLEFLSVYSLYEENLRLFSLLRTYDEKKKSRNILAVSTSMIFILITFLFILALSFTSTNIFNRILVLNNYPSLFNGNNLKILLLVLLLSIVISIPSAFFPLMKIKDKDIKKELEAEE